MRITAGTRWERALAGPIFTLSLVSQLDAVVGGVVEGRVLLDAPTSPPIARLVPILLVELGRGTQTRVEPFSDGSFYRMGLPPGSYAATVEAQVAAQIGLRPDTVRFELRPAASATEPGSSIVGLELLLRPVGREQRALTR